MPFITEEFWHELKQRDEKDCIIISSWPKEKSFDADILKQVDFVFQLVSEIRNVRSAKGLSPKESLSLFSKDNSQSKAYSFLPIVKKLANISEVTFTQETPAQATTFLIQSSARHALRIQTGPVSLGTMPALSTSPTLLFASPTLPLFFS
jgi:valyl-tRNA synthetase